MEAHSSSFDTTEVDKQLGILRANQAKWVSLPISKKVSLLKELVKDLNSTKEEVRLQWFSLLTLSSTSL
jgi:hypothetical protein